MPPIPYGKQSISEEDIEAVVRVLRSDWITQGPAIERFERAVAEICGARYAVAVSSGTAALHLSCIAAGLTPADALWTSPNTFVASANCGRYCGASVDFADIDPRSYNIGVEALDRKLARAEKEGKLPKVVVPVHFAGQPCEMDRIAERAARYGFTVIEDASHAIGARYRGARVGSCAFSDMTVFSFHPVKIITTGEGGMVLTNRDDLHEKLIRLRTHGITRDPAFLRWESEGPWYYQQVELGFNYRMTDIQAALGASQLERMDRFIERRRHLVCRYNEALAGLPLTLPWEHPEARSSHHLYVIRLRLDRISASHRQVFEALRGKGINVNLHYIPVHLQPYYRDLGFREGDCPEAEQYYREAISLPLYFALSEEEQDYVIGCVRGILA